LTSILNIEALRVYALAVSAVVINLIFLANYTGLVRFRAKLVVNAEDAPGMRSKVGDAEHETVLRVHRAHRNALENAVPFFAIGLLYALSDASPRGAWIYFGTFVAARWIHSITYLARLQPWRTVAFGVGVLATVGMLVHVVIASI
jgi:glutathione S-transferase